MAPSGVPQEVFLFNTNDITKKTRKMLSTRPKDPTRAPGPNGLWAHLDPRPTWDLGQLRP